MAAAKISEKFYQDEYGFYVVATTNLNLENLSDGDVRLLMKKPDGTVVKRSVPIADWLDLVTGELRLLFQSGDLDQLGSYEFQIVVRDTLASALRPSHLAKLSVVAPLDDLTEAFL